MIDRFEVRETDRVIAAPPPTATSTPPPTSSPTSRSSARSSATSYWPGRPTWPPLRAELACAAVLLVIAPNPALPRGSASRSSSVLPARGGPLPKKIASASPARPANADQSAR